MTSPSPKKRAPRTSKATKAVANISNSSDQELDSEQREINLKEANLEQIPNASEDSVKSGDLAETEEQGAPEVESQISEDLEIEPDNEVAQEPEQAETVPSDQEYVEGAAALQADTPVRATKPKKIKKPGLLSRFGSWFLNLFRRKKLQPEVEVAPLPVFDDAWAAATLKSISELKISRASAEASAESIQQSLSLLEQEQLRVETWLESLKRSYYWKLEQRMEQNLAQARSDIAEYEGLVRALELPPKGTLKSLREKFHKGLAVNFLTFAIPAFLLFFIPWFSRVDLFRWLLDILRSPLFILLIVTIGAVVAGFAMLLSKVLGTKKISPRKTTKWTLIAMLIPAALYGLYRIKEFLLLVVTPVIEEIRPTVLWVLFILFIFLTLALLIIYYQGWSVFRRTVTEEVSRLENVAAGYVKTRQELARLEFLYGQTTDWMKLLAHTLYRPWKIHPDWKSPNQAQTVSESFPLALRVAQAVENDASESAQLRRTIAHRLLVQGWRTAAFENSLSQIGKYLGYEPDKVNPELLDSDLPHQPNNARKLVLEYFEHSAETANAGTLDLSNVPPTDESVRGKPLPSDVYLVEVARDKLRFLIEKTQGSALAQARPSVQQIVKNPLAELTESPTEAESLELSAWDDFLSEGLGIEDPTQPPIGILSFTDEGKKARSASGVASKVLVPGRFSESLPMPTDSNLKVVPIQDQDQNPPAELMLRFDVVGPMPFSHVTLIQNSSTVRRAEPISQEENDDL